MTMKEELVSGWALAEEILVADTYVFLYVNTLAHSQEDREEEGLEELTNEERARWLVGWLAGWLVDGWLAGWLVGWLGP